MDRDVSNDSAINSVVEVLVVVADVIETNFIFGLFCWTPAAFNCTNWSMHTPFSPESAGTLTVALYGTTVFVVVTHEMGKSVLSILGVVPFKPRLQT